MDFTILNSLLKRCQVMRMTPQLTTHSKIPHHTFARSFDPLRMIIVQKVVIHGVFSVEYGFEPGTIRPVSRDLTTRPSPPVSGEGHLYLNRCQTKRTTPERASLVLP
ncbi:hypothetical protein AVEN_94174-1 [Araneus ventricosus]|uniref:Uncharacterized protein n=1 Tax=Araneus ventricosus TaxID=182803 RepID=A0A4Y2IYT7_ARAVE|nr:hypothetical protein AVEN_94174-1 [Araneus ventricosus]